VRPIRSRSLCPNLQSRVRPEGSRTERGRIARDLHDNVAQGLTSIALHGDENIFRALSAGKLGAKTRAEAVRIARSRGMLGADR